MYTNVCLLNRCYDDARCFFPFTRHLIVMYTPPLPRILVVAFLCSDFTQYTHICLALYWTHWWSFRARVQQYWRRLLLLFLLFLLLFLLLLLLSSLLFLWVGCQCWLSGQLTLLLLLLLLVYRRLLLLEMAIRNRVAFWPNEFNVNFMHSIFYGS